MRLVNNIVSKALILCCSCLLLTGCASDPEPEGADSLAAETESEESEKSEESEGRTMQGGAGNITSVETRHAEEETEEEVEDKPSTFSFFTAFGEYMDAYLQESAEKHSYDWSNLSWEGDIPSYEDETYTTRWGVDVSSHNREIDWAKVKEAGASFAFVRVGYRGYGEAGSLNTDEYARANIEGAKAAGLDVGVYFFSQAVSEEEAVEEADLTLEILDGISLELPVVFDPENIRNDTARTDTVSGEQFTKNTIAFCDRIREAGYEPMIYCNLTWEAYTLDLEQLSDLPVWYADYEAEPQTPYQFTFWQYSESAEVPGISGDADVNLEFIKK